MFLKQYPTFSFSQNQMYNDFDTLFFLSTKFWLKAKTHSVTCFLIIVENDLKLKTLLKTQNTAQPGSTGCVRTWFVSVCKCVLCIRMYVRTCVCTIRAYIHCAYVCVRTCVCTCVWTCVLGIRTCLRTLVRTYVRMHVRTTYARAYERASA